jgi:hypothetical protein
MHMLGQTMDPVRQLKISLLILLLLASRGTTGYMPIEGRRFLEAFSMTIIPLLRQGPGILSYRGKAQWRISK